MIERTTPLAAVSTLIEDRYLRRSAREVCLFLGAGADISSGGITFRQFKKEFFRLILNKQTLVNEDIVTQEVNSFFSRTSEQEIRARLVDAAFDVGQRRQPSDSYMLLALALEKLAVDMVVTTNFDIMLETAERLLGLSVLRVYAKGIALPDETDARMREPNRVPYLKLHGCLNGRTITHITDEELRKGNYPLQFRRILGNRLASADLIVAGYSGYDPGLASLLAHSLKDSDSRIYWCDPRTPDRNAPLVKALSKRHIVYLHARFDEVIEAIAWPVLKAPSFSSAKAIFIPCLLDWRVECANRDFINSHGYSERRDIRNLLVRRRSVETQLRSFLASESPLAIVSGPSGVGKSVLGLRLLESYKNDDDSNVILISASNIGIGRDFSDHIAAQLGGLGSVGPFNFAEFGLWLRHNGKRLIVYLDALNEHAVALDHVANLLRDIVRFCYFLPPRPPIRVIVSVRQETWNRLCTREDRGRLATVCWNPTDIPAVVHSIQLGVLTDEELEEGIDLLCQYLGKASIFGDLPPQSIERLRDPYLLAGVSDDILERSDLEALNWLYGPARHIYDRIFKGKLARNYSDRDADNLGTVLARVAFLTIERNEDRFRAADLMFYMPGNNQGDDIVRVFKDLGILTEAEDGRLRFVHERTQEYFLAKALDLPECPFSLRTLEGLNRVLKEFDHRHQVIAAIRTYFLFDPNIRFTLIADITLSPNISFDPLAEHRLLAFAKELMVDFACDNPRAFHSWFHQTRMEVKALEQPTMRIEMPIERVERHWRAMIQAAAHLPDMTALEVLTEGAQTGTILARTEANIYATDKIVRILLQSDDSINLLNDQQLSFYYADQNISRLRRIGRVLGLMSQIGPDNTHPQEYRKIRLAAEKACNAILGEEKLTGSELNWFSHFIFDERDRYVFNGDLEGMRHFFRNPARSEFIPILERLEHGGVLIHDDINVLRPYISEIYQDLEFQLGNFLFIFSAANDLKATQKLWEEQFDSFNNETPPDTVDFFQATAPYMYVVNGYEYDGMMGRHIDRILQDCPRIIEYEPGRERGKARGFTDEFDMVFEDGFNPIASYATLLPSRNRKQLLWRDYISRPAAGFPLPVYTEHLTAALKNGEIRKALRIIHALGQFIMLWPREGLWSMVGTIQHDHPTIHRAVVRVLAEAYNRYPVEALRFFANSGIVLSPGDLRDIRARIDPRTGRRQFEGLQWARVLHFLLSLPEARQRFFQMLRIAYTASSARSAVHRIAGVLAWTKKTPSR